MFGRKKEKAEIIISPQEGVFLWEVSLNDDVGEVTVKVESGCRIVCYLNGILDSDKGSGSYVINPKKQNVRVLAYNSDKQEKMLFGVGGIPYKDREISSSTEVGMHGSYYVRVKQAATIFKTFGKGTVTLDDVSERVQETVKQIAGKELSEVVQRYSYTNIATQLSNIASEIKEVFTVTLNGIGLELCGLSVAKIHFPEEFIAEEKEHFERIKQNNIADDQMRRERKVQRTEVEIMKPLIEAAATVSQKTQIKVCPGCGTEVKQNIKYCPKCGKYLQ